MSEQSYAFDAYHKWLGIPPAEQPPNYYRLLGINLYESDPEVIQEAADRQMAHVRNYQTGPHSARSQQLLNEISLARICLLNPSRKADYDARTRAELAQQAMPQRPMPPTGYQRAPQPGPGPPMPAASIVNQPMPAPWQPAHLPQASTMPPGPEMPQPPRPRQPEPSVAVQTEHKSVAETRLAKRPPAWQGPAIVGGFIALIVGAVFLAITFSDSGPQRRPPGAAVAKHDDGQPTGVVPLIPSDPPASTDTSSPGGNTTKTTGTSTTKSKTTKTSRKVRPLAPGQKGPVDLLPYIDPEKHARRGNWKFVEGVLMGPQVETARLRLPYDAPEEYKLTLEVTRTLGDENLNLILVSGDVQFALLFDGRAGHVSGLHLLDDKTAMANESTFDGQVFTNRKWAMVEVSVRRWGVKATVDGKTIVEWIGDIKRLSMDAGVSGVDAGSLYLGSSESVYLFRQVRIEPLEPAEPPKVVAKPPPKVEYFPETFTEEKPSRSLADLVNMPGSTGARRPPPKNRQPVPEQAARDAATKLIREEVYPADFEAAKAPPEKFALAQKLLTAAEGTTDDPAAQYVLYEAVAQLAGESGQFQLAWQAADALAYTYVMSPLAIKHDSLEKAAKFAKRPDELKFLSETYAHLAADAVYEDEYETASKLAVESVSTARRAKDLALLARAERGLAHLRALEAEFDTVQAARDSLQFNPDDPAANLAWGRFVCLFKRDWTTGLPLLAKAGDEQFAPLAARELARPGDAAAQMELGDAWWSLADALEGKIAQESARLRAARWYRPSVSAQTGLAQVKIQKRLVEASHIELGVAPGEWSGLLHLVDASRHAAGGTWERKGTQLSVTSQPRSYSRVMIPVSFTGNYSLQFRFVRTAGKDGVAFIIPLGDKQCLLTLGDNDRYRLDLNRTDRRDIRGGPLVNNRLQLAEVEVDQTSAQAKIRIKLNGQQILFWQGDKSTMALADRGWALSRTDAPGLATFRDNTVLFLDARVKLESGATLLYMP